MQAYLVLRDTLRCLSSASETRDPYRWLHAAIDLRTSLLGEQARKAAIPEIHALLATTQSHLNDLAREHPQYEQSIRSTCEKLQRHMDGLQEGAAAACSLLERDALLNSYLNTQKKQDWLGHKPCLPQSLPTLWQHAESRTRPLATALRSLNEAVEDLDAMLHDFVGWEQRTANGGHDQIMPPRDQTFGLLVLGLPAESVAEGLVPDISGNRHAIRLRFQHWRPGEPPADVTEDLSYKMMLVPIA